MLTDLILMCNGLLKNAILEKISDVDTRQILEKEWTNLFSYLVLLPFQTIIFVWFLSSGPLLAYCFVSKYFHYISLWIAIILIALVRTILVNTLQEDSTNINCCESSRTDQISER
ncbi:hypothetical protein NH340_JMT00012 [Sarcoptes scabiei]|nr:hypothetical protein NH340_JMT00012 [Sarcoptes scabiei]